MVHRVMGRSVNNERAGNQRTSRDRWRWAAARPSRECHLKHFTVGFRMSVRP